MRKGVDLYDSKQQIVKDYHNYDMAQVFIKNPLLVNGFKFDIRLFMFVSCDHGIFLFKKGYKIRF